MVLSTPFPPCDGIGYHVYSLSKELIALGHEITVITRSDGHDDGVSNLEGIRIIRGPFLPTYPLHVTTHGIWTNHKIRCMLNDFDVVHYHTPLTPRLNIRSPSITTVHSSMVEEVKQMESGFFFKKMIMQVMVKTLTKYYMKKTIKNSNAIIAVSSSVRNELSKYYGIVDNVHVIHNGVDTDFFRPIEQSGRSNYILYVGRLSYRKGLLELVDAFKDIAKESNVDLVLCGKGPLRKVLEDSVKKAGLDDRVHFKGFVTRSELRDLYQKAKMFVAASSYETGPLTALEAMSCGLPLVVTRVGIMPDLIIDGQNGLFVEKNNSGDITLKCLAILSDEELSRKMGERARKTAVDGCQWSKVVKDIQDLYSEVSKKRANP